MNLLICKAVLFIALASNRLTGKFVFLLKKKAGIWTILSFITKWLLEFELSQEITWKRSNPSCVSISRSYDINDVKEVKDPHASTYCFAGVTIWMDFLV